MQLNTAQQIIKDQKTEDSMELIRYIRGENPKMPRLKREQQREIVMLSTLGLQNYEIQYLMHLKPKQKKKKTWRI